MSDEPEPVVETIVRAEVFQQFIDQATTIVDECILHIGSDGIRTRVVDPANVAMVDIQIEPAALEHAPDGSFVVGASLNKLDDYLGGASGDDPVSLAFNTEKRTLNIRHTNREFNAAMIDPDSVRNEPDIPELEFAVDATLPAGTLDDAVDTAALVTDQVHFEADPGAGEIHVVGEGDIDDATVTLDSDTLAEKSRIDEDVKSIFSIGYMNGDSGILSGVPSGTDLRWRFDDEMPLKFNYEYANGHAHVELMCAPRIQTN